MNLLSSKANLPTDYGEFEILVYINDLGKENVVLKTKELADTPVLRIHSECITSEVFHSLKCDCKQQLDESLKIISQSPTGGLVIYLRQEGRGIGLTEKIKAYSLQEKGYSTFEANLELGFKEDLRDYDDSIEILKSLDVSSVKIITNNPVKYNTLIENSIHVSEIIKVKPQINKHNEKYIKDKVSKGKHWIDI